MKTKILFISTILFVLMAFATMMVSFAEEGGGSSILINVRAGGKTGEGIIKVFSKGTEHQEIAKGKTAQPISVPPGSYELEIICTTLLNKPSQSITVDSLAPAQRFEKEISFPAGTIILQTIKGNSNLKGLKMRFKREGEEQFFEGTGKTWEPITLSPGRYDAEVTLKKGVVFPINSIDVYEGSTRTIPIEVQ